MIIPRPSIEIALERALARTPVVALIGARQVGKTTLARKLVDRVKGTIYLDLAGLPLPFDIRQFHLSPLSQRRVCRVGAMTP
jgi:molybdopterin-guanine dinucleotide biosynthesis protein